MTALSRFLKARHAEDIRTWDAMDPDDIADHPAAELARARVRGIRAMQPVIDQYDSGFFGPGEASLIEARLGEEASHYTDHPDYDPGWNA